MGRHAKGWGVMSHTPGPLHVESEEAIRIRDSGGTKTCTLNHLRGPNGLCGRIPIDEVQANARLYASAPDLLEVCKAYEAWEGDIIINGDWGPMGMDPYPRLTEAQYDRMLELQAMRNAAIAKAKGESK